MTVSSFSVNDWDMHMIYKRYIKIMYIKLIRCITLIWHIICYIISLKKSPVSTAVKQPLYSTKLDLRKLVVRTKPIKLNSYFREFPFLFNLFFNSFIYFTYYIYLFYFILKCFLILFISLVDKHFFKFFRPE